jgi:hypothetical protein
MSKPSLYERIRDTADDACPKVATTVRPSIRDRFWILELRCPFCAKVHTHGGGSIDHSPALGHRLSHCVTRRPLDYELVEEEATHEH